MTWEEVTAVSTLALAAVTAWTARSTRRLAAEANAETRANWRPVVMPSVEADGTGCATAGLALVDGVLSLRVRNVGRGPALTVTVKLWEETAPLEPIRGHAASDVVAPGETIGFEWRNFDAPRPPKEMGIHVWSQLEGLVTYGDAGYVQYETELKVGFRIDGAVSLLDARFLGASGDRVKRSDRAWHRMFIEAVALERRLPTPLRGLARRVARMALNRLR